MPPGLRTYLDRLALTEGTVLIRQGDRTGDVYVVESGRLAVELTSPDGTRVRLRSIRPGVVVGEIAMYSGFRARRTSWPRRPAWCCGSRGAHSRGWKPTSPSWPLGCTDGSRGRCRTG